MSIWGRDNKEAQAAVPVAEQPKRLTMSEYEVLSRRIKALEVAVFETAKTKASPETPGDMIALRKAIDRIGKLFMEDLGKRDLQIVKVPAVEEHEEIRPITKSKVVK